MNKQTTVQEAMEQREVVYAELGKSAVTGHLAKVIRIAREDMNMNEKAFRAWLTETLEADGTLQSLSKEVIGSFVDHVAESLYVAEESKFRVALNHVVRVIQEMADMLADALRYSGDVFEKSMHWIGTTGKKGLHKAADGIDHVSKRPEDKTNALQQWIMDRDAKRREAKARK